MRFWTAVLRFRILWMRRASRENTNAGTGSMDVRGSRVFAAERRFSAPSLPDEAAIFVRGASERRKERLALEVNQQQFRDRKCAFPQNRRGILRLASRPEIVKHDFRWRAFGTLRSG